MKSLPLIALLLVLSPYLHAASATSFPKISSLQPMDRWVDVNWNTEGKPAGGFVVAISRDRKVFERVQQVKPEEHSASVFVTDQIKKDLGTDGKLYLRVAALDATGRPGKWSKVVSFHPATHRDIEAEIRGKFGYWNDCRPYNANDPAYTVLYSEEQKRDQRRAAVEMFAKLQQAASSRTGPREFIIPPGIYRVDPGQMKLRGVSNFVIHAPGVEVIVDSEKGGDAFAFEDCSNITLTGREEGSGESGRDGATPSLIVDSEQLPMSVSRILACDPEKGTLDVEILPGYSTKLPDQERMMAYNPKGQMVNVEQMGWNGVIALEGSKFRLTTKAFRSRINRESVLVPGNLLVLHSNPQGGHGVCGSRGCRDMTFESIRMVDGGGSPADHGTAGYTVYRDWRLVPQPGTSRLPIATGLGQFSKNGGMFLFEDCEFGPHLDDGINLLSMMSIVGKQNSGTEVVITGTQQPTVGSTLTFYDYTTWTNFGTAKVVASERIDDPKSLGDVNAFAKKNRTVQNARCAYRTLLDRPIKTTPFAMVIHSDYRADSIVVRGCLIYDQLAQIMLLQGAKGGLIENNLLLRSTAAAISPQFSQYWWEGPMPSNLMIRNNVVRDNPVDAPVNGSSGNGSIAVYAGTKYPTSERLLSGFRIEGNLIVNPSVDGIVIRNAEQVLISHNRIINPGARDVMFDEKPMAEPSAAICLDAVSHATVSDNEIVFGNPRCQQGILVESNCDTATLKIENNRESTLKP